MAALTNAEEDRPRHHQPYVGRGTMFQLFGSGTRCPYLDERNEPEQIPTTPVDVITPPSKQENTGCGGPARWYAAGGANPGTLTASNVYSGCV